MELIVQMRIGWIVGFGLDCLKTPPAAKRGHLPLK